MNYGDVQADWADAIWATLEANGVRHVVVSPGSRSTPLVLGVARSDLSAHVVIDERSAAFFALGAARARREPVALVCTSGTAGAHYLPAVIEAYEAGHPLVVITADRPPELQGLGASQTTDQRCFFGAHTVFSATLGVPSGDAAHLASCASLVARLVGTASERMGPVHLNVPMRKPFEPTVDRTPGPAPAPRVLSSAARLDDDGIATLAAEIDDADAGWVVVGPARLDDFAADAVREFCARTGFVLVCEPSSNLRDGTTTSRAGDSFLRADGFELALAALEDESSVLPDVVLQLGPGAVSNALNQLLDHNRGRFRHLVVAEHGWPDPNRTASVFAIGAIAETLARVTARLRSEKEDDIRLDTFMSACGDAWERALAALLYAEDRASGPGVARAVAASLPDGGMLFVGNSRPTRDLSQYCDALPPSVGVVSQRGVAGIDGNVSGILGASATVGVPITGLIGDIAFLHDASALLAHALVRGPAVIVVVNNRGGRIFEELPIANATGVERDTFDQFWITPQDVSICAIAEAYGVSSASCDSLSGLTREVTAAHQRDGVTVVEVIVDPEFSAEVRRRAASPIDAPESEE